MTLRKKAIDSFVRFKTRWFPERQIFLRTDGEVRYFRLDPDLQMVVAACAVFGLVWTLAGTVNMIVADATIDAKKSHIRSLEAHNSALNGKVHQLREGTNARLDRIEARQDYLDALARGETEAKARNKKAQAERKPERISGLMSPVTDTLAAGWRGIGGMIDSATNYINRPSEQTRLARLDAAQTASARSLAARYRKMTAETEKTLARLRISPDRLMQQTGVGGPYVPAAPRPQFGRGEEAVATAFTEAEVAMQETWALLAALERVPLAVPASGYYISSRFGLRVDPFNASMARHSGLDMVGARGTPIKAAASGRVLRAGWNGDYGNLVEIRHDSGFVTRYGHMSAVTVRPGQLVAAGERIGKMGATGRATTTHLHYEVLKNGQLVDPYPYVKASHHVLEIKNRL